MRYFYISSELCVVSDCRGRSLVTVPACSNAPIRLGSSGWPRWVTLPSATWTRRTWCCWTHGRRWEVQGAAGWLIFPFLASILSSLCSRHADCLPRPHESHLALVSLPWNKSCVFPFVPVTVVCVCLVPAPVPFSCTPWFWPLPALVTLVLLN